MSLNQTLVEFLNKILHRVGFTKEFGKRYSNIFEEEATVVSKVHEDEQYIYGMNIYDGIVSIPEKFKVTIQFDNGALTVDDKVLFENINKGERVVAGYRIEDRITLDYKPYNFSEKTVVDIKPVGKVLDFVKKDHYVLYQKDQPFDHPNEAKLFTE